MFDFVPLIYYADVFFYVLLLIVIITAVNAQFGFTSDRSFESLTGWVLLTFVIFYIGLRPVSGTFIDMTTYAHIFDSFKEGRQIPDDGDFFFYLYTYWAAKIMTVEMYFLLCAMIYIIPLYIVSKTWFKKEWFFGFLFMVAAFSFWAYGTNGIRNGMAGSLFLLGISRKKLLFQLLIIIVAINMHKTMLLPALAFGVSFFVNKPQIMIIIWLICIPASLIAGGLFENFIANIGLGDDRLSYLTDEVNSSSFSSVGFRWDFLVYSGSAIFAGWYFIIKKNFQDKIYFQLFTTYVLTNAFWILVIRANFSNRFAYLSWFMIGFIVIYPLLKKRILLHQTQLIGLILVIYFAFTFLMNVILK